MKRLQQLDNMAKGRLLYDLFQDDIPEVVRYVKTIADAICASPDEVKHNWENDFFTADALTGLAKDTKDAIEDNGVSIYQSGRRFSDQLFDGYVALFTVHCLHEYIKHEQCKNQSFKHAVQMLF